MIPDENPLIRDSSEAMSQPLGPPVVKPHITQSTDVKGQEVSGTAKRFGTAGGSDPANEREYWWPACWHTRWTKIDKTSTKDRVVVLEKCKRCPKTRSVVIYKDRSARKVYVARDTFNVPSVAETLQSPVKAPEIAPKTESIVEETGSE